MIKGGPKIINDGLVLCLDAHSGHSYPGEPTDNIQPNDASSRFTSSNTWGTYNTNQYNSNQYFSIGTISSVSNNIVTTSSNHPFRTFDAVRPQTTGGGVSSGTNYFIKKLSDTTFTIHAYNSSQDGTQGYIRSDGYHQVHESIATDTRVSINSTSFPTMWWGPPHLPNTCHVKELRVGGGYRRGTNAMRVHVTRTTGVDGGMSYGVQPSGVSQGDTVTSSWWARSSLPGTKTVQYYTYWGSGYAANATNFTPTQEWQKFTHTWTASNTYNFIQYWFQGAHSTPWWFEVADLQTEINKSYSTPYVLPGTDRSATNGWLDISGNDNHGTLTNMVGTGATHYRAGTGLTGGTIMPVANSYLDFDGTNDYLSIPQFDFTSTHSLEWWFNTDNLTEKYSGGYAGHMLCWGHSPSERIQLRTNGGIRIYIHDGSSGTNFDTSNFSVTAGEWIHITATLDWISKSVKFYQNGVLKDTIDISSMGSWNYTGASNPYDYIDFGRNVNNNNIFYDGKLASIKIYNKVLTAAEVLSNYNATKGRFL